MIDLAMCMTLQNEGFGTYGKTLFFGTSPVLDTGSVTNAEGIWVNALTSTATCTRISSRSVAATST